MKKFKKIYIETTNICNLSCDFCPKTTRTKRTMNIDEFNRVLERIKPYTEYIYLHLMGEPFINPNLNKFLISSYEEGFKVNITTNGTLIDNVDEILLNAKALRQINFSLHSFEANSNPYELEVYLSKIIEFIKKANSSTNIICSIRLWNMDSEELKGKNNLNSRIIDKLQKDLEIEFSLVDKLQESKQFKIRKNLYLNMDEKFQWGSLELKETEENIFCYGLRDQLGILVDGTVVPCCLDSDGNIPLGNIFEESLDEIINSERARAIYNGFSSRRAVEELCKRCGFPRKFNK